MILIQCIICFFFASLVQTFLIYEDCECGVGNDPIEVRIIGGSKVVPHTYPWVVYLKSGDVAFCGGAIINDRYILTAGHCAYNLQPEMVTVTVGGDDTLLQDGEVYDIEEFIIHENYTRFSSYDHNDIALIKLQRRIEFNKNVGTICLPNPRSNFDYRDAVVTGWGTTENGSPSRFLLETHVEILPDDRCLKSPKIAREYAPFLNICAFNQNRDACRGDSGSALVHESNPNKFEVAGVVSWGKECGSDAPGVYTEVAHYIPWIAMHTFDAGYCSI